MKFCTASGRLQPGFRFYPTDEELVMYYLKRKVLGKRLEPIIVAEVDIYQFHPEDLRDLACLLKDRNWYFFCPRGKKYGCGDRTNRATNAGYWKATGNDRLVTYGQRTVGRIKTLVFHLGKPPKGDRTDWVMHEFRLDDKKLADLGVCQDSYVLCKIFKKSGWGPKNGEQYGAPFVEEEWDDEDEIPNCAQMVPYDVQNQNTSAVTHFMEYTNATYTSGQVYSGSVSVSAVDQALPSTPNASANMVSSSDALIPNPSHALVDQVPCSMAYSGDVSVSAVDQSPFPTADRAAANLASSSKSLIPYYNNAVQQANAAMPIRRNWASSSNTLLPNYYNPAVEVPSLAMPSAAAGIASTSAGPFLFFDDDEIFTADDFEGIFEGLPDLDNEIAPGSWGDMYEEPEGGLGLALTDLDESL